MRSSQYNPAVTVQTIQPIRSNQKDPASFSSEGNPQTRPSLIINTHPQLPQLIIFHPPQRPLPPDIFYIPLLLHLLMTYLLRIDISPSPRPIFWPWGWGYINPKQISHQKMQQKRNIENVWQQRPLGRVKNNQQRQLRMGIYD